jgi:DNA-directed RNA polymerase subunit omega
MARVTVEQCLKQVNNHFALVILAAQRARQLTGGKLALVACDNKAAVTALREIGAGRVTFVENVDDVIRTFVAERKALDGVKRQAAAKARRHATGIS